MSVLDQAFAAAGAANMPEDIIAAPMALLRTRLGDQQAHMRPGALQDGQRQFFVAGGFLATPDGRHLMLTGNAGFPPEQKRLCIPLTGGDPGRVISSGQALLLPDTRSHTEFRQYLKTARMGSAAYAPLISEGRTFGLIIVAALAANTLRESDLAVLKALAPVIVEKWMKLEGPSWLAAEYSRAVDTGEAFFVGQEGVS